MTEIKLEVGKTYELNNGEIRECVRMNGKDPLAVDAYGRGPFVIGGWLYHQDGRFAEQGRDHHLSVKRCVEEAPTEWDGESPITDINVKVQTRGGSDFVIYTTEGKRNPLAGEVKWITGEWMGAGWDEYGKYAYADGDESEYDLVPIPKTVVRETWLNLYPDGTCGVHVSEKNARKGRGHTCIETRKITWEVPQ